MIQILTALLMLPSFSLAQAIKPGIWKADSSLKLSGVPLPKSEDEECILESEAKDIRQTISKELKKRGCEPTKWVVKGKKLEIALKCSKDDLEATGSLRGSFTDKSYEISGDAEGSYKFIPSTASFVLKGQWVKNCGK